MNRKWIMLRLYLFALMGKSGYDRARILKIGDF